MKSDSPPAGGLEVRGPEGYLSTRGNAETEPIPPVRHSQAHVHKGTRPSVPASILGVLRRGSGAATNVTLGERSLRRRYAGAKMCRVRQEGVHFLNRSKDTDPSGLGRKPLGVTKGGGYALKFEGQEAFFPVRARPTADSIYLARRIEERWNRNGLTPAALQKLVDQYGDRLVEDKLRELHGFPPEEAIRSPYAYLETMLRENL